MDDLNEIDSAASAATVSAAGSRRGSRRHSRSPDLIELSSSNSTTKIPQDISNSDLQSTDSEIEQNESTSGGGGHPHRHNRGGSPEAWSTNSDSPTPTNSVAERHWAKENLWQGILGGDEHRQLLGTEEESSDRHSSDDDNETDLESLYQITPEQREYYHKQFKAVQPDPNGLLSGHIARVFFEKSRIPIEELRHIWQLCDVTRDGALSLAEFTAAMHLVVLRRNNIPLPQTLPPCLHPSVLNNQVSHHQIEPPEADLLHLGDDDKTDSPIVPIASSSLSSTLINSNTNTVAVANVSANAINTTCITANIITNNKQNNMLKDNSNSDYKRMLPSTHQPPTDCKNIINLSSLSSSSSSSSSNAIITQQEGNALNRQQQQHHAGMKVSSSSPQNKNRSVSNSPPPLQQEHINESTTSPTIHQHHHHHQSNKVKTVKELYQNQEWIKKGLNQHKEWTKFTESPTSSVSSPGPKPVNFDMQRTAQAVVSDPQILHPVPLRVTPVGAEAVEEETRLNRRSENFVYDSSTGVLRENDSSSPKQIQQQQPNQYQQHHSHLQNSHQQQQQQQQSHRDSLTGGGSNAAIQRPQAKKIPAKSIGAIPPPPQREPSFGSNNSNDIIPVTEPPVSTTVVTTSYIHPHHHSKEPPPLPPPRPHRHARSSSLDLNKLKMGSGGPSQPEVVNQIVNQNSFEIKTDSSVNSGFADFTQFPSNKTNSNDQMSSSYVGTTTVDHYQTPSIPQLTATVRPIIPSQRVSAFEVYKKPNTTPRGSQSPEAITTSAPPISAATTQHHHYHHHQQQLATIPAYVPQPSTSSSAAIGTVSNASNIFVTSGVEYEKRVAAISETLRHVSFKPDRNIIDVLRHLREQNVLLLRLCNDLSEELLTVQHKKEDLRLKIENSNNSNNMTVSGGSIATNLTGGSTGSGSGGTMHSNV